MLKVRLPDGSERPFDGPVTVAQVAASIGAGLAKAALAGKVDWKVVVPQNAVVGSYYIQAINKTAPHPAAARLWQEFLFSPEGQNLWLKGFARPVLAEKMEADGTIDKAAFAALPPTTGEAVVLTQDQQTKVQEYLKANWTQAVG